MAGIAKAADAKWTVEGKNLADYVLRNGAFNSLKVCGKLFLPAIAVFYATTLSVAARFEGVHRFSQVPITRLLSNLGNRESCLPPWDRIGRADLEFKIGRLHAMAYARKSEIADANGAKVDFLLMPAESFYGYHHQPVVQPATNISEKQLAQDHLQKAIVHLSSAVTLNPSLTVARLGLAWCMDQAGKKPDALKLYRRVFQEAYKADLGSKGSLSGLSVTVECSQYLLTLLDPTKDAAEIKDIKEKTEQMDHKFDAVTPIVIPLTSNCRLKNLVKASSVTFDLNGQGAKVCNQWISAQAGWLVFDPNASGRIESGISLVGGVTFWLFWKDGYDVLEALDDNLDGRLAGRELEDLSIWADTNGDGVAQAGEVQSLKAWNVTELSCDRSKLQRMRSGLSNAQGITFGNGEKRVTYDVWIPQSPVANTSAH
ncbi:MAG TPA: tetratricopeptide repeat protein [Oculatellaceae cyanobacterium]